MTRITRGALILIIVTGCGTSGQQPTEPSRSSTTPAGWQTHTDAVYGFAVDYPPDHVILPEPAGPTDTRPATLRRVRFQTKQIAAGQFADLEPAILTIQVMERDRRQTLREWLQASRRLPAGAAVSPVQVAGAYEGVRIRLAHMLAPNEFVYLAGADYVYGLTPLGDRSEQMLASFRFVAR
jgi:hypothetical protein